MLGKTGLGSQELPSSDPCGNSSEPSPTEGFDVLVSEQFHGLHALLVNRHQHEVSALQTEIDRLQAELEAARRGVDGGAAAPPQEEGYDSVQLLSEAVPSASRSSAFKSEATRNSKWRHTLPAANLSQSMPTANAMTKQWSELNLRPAFKGDADDPDCVPMTLLWSKALTSDCRVHAGDVMHESIPWRRRLVTRPNGRSQLCHDVTNVLVMTWDLSTIPMEGAGFLADVTDGYKVFRMLVTVWWSMEMLLNFCRGYLQNGVVEMRLAPIARAYARSWFLGDLLLVALDWCTFFLEDFMAYFGMARGVKMLRISRLVRLLRLVRLFRIFGKLPNVPPELARFIDPDILHTALRIGFWVVAILFLNHMVACAWYGLGSGLSGTGMPTWVQVCRRQYLLNTDAEPDLSWFYATSLHWTLTQFTPASMEVVPENTYERFFAVCTILCAIIFFSSLLSSIAAAVALFRRKREEQHLQRASLIRFLQENHVSLDLAGRIQAFLSMQQTKRNVVHRVHESDVPQLKQLPEILKEQLASEVFLPVITRHPLFKGVRAITPSCVTAVCIDALSQQSVLASHPVFCLGEECRAVYFVVAGEMAYFHGVSTKPVPASQHPYANAMVTAHSWSCEYVLLVAWEHQGLMTTLRMPCELALLDAAVFHGVLLRWPEVKNFCRRYALIFMADMEQSDAELSDLRMEEVDAHGIAERALACE